MSPDFCRTITTVDQWPKEVELGVLTNLGTIYQERLYVAATSGYCNLSEYYWCSTRGPEPHFQLSIWGGFQINCICRKEKVVFSISQVAWFCDHHQTYLYPSQQEHVRDINWTVLETICVFAWHPNLCWTNRCPPVLVFTKCCWP